MPRVDDLVFLRICTRRAFPLSTTRGLTRYALVILVACISEWQSQGQGCL